MIKIIVTGPESSGKSSLCKIISKHFKIPYAKEYAREYLNTLTHRTYQKEDLLKIARGQFKSEKNAQLLDTDLITIKIWSEYKYGSCNKWNLEKIKQQKTDDRLYFLCKPDIEWRADPLRENPKDRMKLFKLFQNELNDTGHDYTIIDGKDRELKAIKKISQKKLLF